MAKGASVRDSQRAVVVLAGTVVAVVVVACLYWARAVFIPVALAVFLAFLLSPVVKLLQGFGIRRTPAVLIVVLITSSFLSGVGWIVTREVGELVAELPNYRDNIESKIKTLREMTENSATTRLGKMFEWNPGDSRKSLPKATTSGALAPAKQVQSDVAQADSGHTEVPAWITGLPTLLGSMTESLGSLALAVVLSIFMLLKRENLRNRLIRLIGQHRITATTKAVDEAGQRISRFLLMQLIVNGAFGIAMTIGLLLIGVEYALLWGFLAALLRYVPYIGPWIAAIPPTALSFIMFEGWSQPLMVAALFLLIELICSNAIEPWLYGQSMGVSEVGLLVAAAFWAFLWGPIGLVLSSPLTVCLVVLGKHVPQLAFFEVLLGDEPVLELRVSFYQRLLARDQDEATHIALTHTRESNSGGVYDQILLPALSYAKRDLTNDALTEGDEQFILGAISEIVEDLGERPVPFPATPPPSKVSLLACPARDAADQIALEMLQQLLDSQKWDVRVVPINMLTADLVELAAKENAGMVCIGSVAPGGLAHTRYLCKRLRARLPDVRILVGRWGVKGNTDQIQEQILEAGANHVATTLAETSGHLVAWLPVLAHQEKSSQAMNDIDAALSAP